VLVECRSLNSSLIMVELHDFIGMSHGSHDLQ
jgi:hypothetical protein